MTTPACSLNELRKYSGPATVHVGAEIGTECWPSAAAMLSFWQQNRNGQDAPDRTALSPVDIADQIPLMSIFDVSWNPFDLHCRMMGSEFVRTIGFDATGTSTESLPRTDSVLVRARWIVEQRCPMLVQGLQLVWSESRSYMRYDTLCLPFLGQGGEVDTVVYINQFHL